MDVAHMLILSLPERRLSGKKKCRPAHAGIRPALYQDGLADRCIQVTDLECVAGCRLLLSREALLAGGSSGAALMAARKMADEISPGATCVMIFPDRGERYLDTIFSDQWVMQTLGSLPGECDAGFASQHSNLKAASA